MTKRQLGAQFKFDATDESFAIHMGKKEHITCELFKFVMVDLLITRGDP